MELAVLALVGYSMGLIIKNKNTVITGTVIASVGVWGSALVAHLGGDWVIIPSLLTGGISLLAGIVYAMSSVDV